MFLFAAFSLNSLSGFHKGHFLIDSLSNVMVLIHCVLSSSNSSQNILAVPVVKGFEQKDRRKWNCKGFLADGSSLLKAWSKMITLHIVVYCMLFHRFLLTYKLLSFSVPSDLAEYAFMTTVSFKIFLVRTEWAFSSFDSLMTSEIF